MKSNRLFSLTTIALGAAIIAVLSPLSIPIGVVPITLQTLAVGLIATILQARETFFAVLLYLLLGFIGLPVFTGGASGLAVLFGPTGGFLLAFLLVGTLISFLIKKSHYHLFPTGMINLFGHLLMLVIGTIWLKFFANVSWSIALKGAFLPFIPIEILKAIFVTIVGLAILRALSRTNKYFTN